MHYNFNTVAMYVVTHIAIIIYSSYICTYIRIVVYSSVSIYNNSKIRCYRNIAPRLHAPHKNMYKFSVSHFKCTEYIIMYVYIQYVCMQYTHTHLTHSI